MWRKTAKSSVHIAPAKQASVRHVCMSLYFSLQLTWTHKWKHLCHAPQCLAAGYHLLFKLCLMPRFQTSNFIHLRTKKRNLNTISTSPTPEDLNSIPKLRHLTEPTATELDSFYTSLSKIKNCKPGILSILPRFSHGYMPLSKQSVLPPPLSDLFLKEHLNLPYTDLIQECQ